MNRWVHFFIYKNYTSQCFSRSWPWELNSTWDNVTHAPTLDQLLWWYWLQRGGDTPIQSHFIIHRTTEVRIGSEGKNWHAIDIRIHTKKASTLHAQCDTFDTKCCMAFDNDSRAEQSMCCRKRRLSSDTMLSTWLVQNKTSRRSWKNAEKSGRDQKEEEQLDSGSQMAKWAKSSDLRETSKDKQRIG